MVSCEPKSCLQSEARRLRDKQPKHVGRNIRLVKIAEAQQGSMPIVPKAPSVILAKSADEFIQQHLDQRILEIERLFEADAITFCGPLVFGVEAIIRATVEAKYAQRPRRRKLVIILTTNGGYLEVVRRAVDVLRAHYRLIEFIVPSYAYSAGTVFVMAGDAIHMDYYSRLGPIDPQIETKGGHQVPALGYLERYNDLIQKATAGIITPAEVQLLIQGFDQGELYHFSQARDESIEVLKKWLVKYKFKNWKKTKSRKLKVTRQMKIDRAAAIANELNNTKRWYSHGYGISMDVLTQDREKIKLMIDDFGATPELSDAIRTYDELLSDYLAKLRIRGVIHFAGAFLPFMMAGG